MLASPANEASLQAVSYATSNREGMAKSIIISEILALVIIISDFRNRGDLWFDPTVKIIPFQ